MTISRTSLVDRAYLRNLSRGVQTPYARYDSLVSQAMSSLARKVAESGSDLLKKDFSLGVSSGTYSLTTHLTASEPLLLGFLLKAKITSSDSSQPWQPLPDFAQLSLERPTFGMIYFTVNGTSVIAADTNGALSSLTTTATARTYFVPLPATLSGNLQLEEMAIEELSILAGGQDAGEQAAA